MTRFIEDVKNIPTVLSFYRAGLKGSSTLEKLAQGSKAIKHTFIWHTIKWTLVSLQVLAALYLLYKITR